MKYFSRFLLFFIASSLSVYSHCQKMQTEQITGAFTLSTEAPVHAISFSRNFSARPPSAIQVQVDSITDPGSANFAVKAFILEKEGDSILIGTFTPFPVSKPGKFLLSLHSYVESLKKRNAGHGDVHATLKLNLHPYTKNAKLVVRFHSVSWVIEES
jgi:hypothetical protein